MAENVFQHTVIRASAGSGKTYQLSGRFLQLLLAGAPVDSILATTFTREAAFEIQNRILERLATGALSDENAQQLSGELYGDKTRVSREQLRDLTAKITRSLDRLRVSTLDAFFMRIAKGFQFEIGLPPNWRVVEEVDDNELLRRALQATFAHTTARNALELARMLFKGETKKSLEAQIVKAVNDALDLYRESNEENWTDLSRHIPDADELDVCIDALNAAELPTTQKKAPRANYVKGRNNVVKALQNKDWDAIFKITLCQRVLSGELNFDSAPIEGDLLEALKKIIAYVKAQKLAKMAAALSARYILLSKVYEFYRQFKREQGAYRFQDLAYILSQLQMKNELQKLVYRLDAKTSHLLLDEFQDSSVQQWAIIKPFAESITRRRADELNLDDPADVAKLTSFFCVGDVKQAIYAWRGGVAEIFQEIEETLPNLEKKGMAINYRSCPTIMEVVNKVFGNLDRNTIWPSEEINDSEVVDLKNAAINKAVKKWKSYFQEHKAAEKNQDKLGYWALEVAPRPDDTSQETTGEAHVNTFEPIYRSNNEVEPRKSEALDAAVVEIDPNDLDDEEGDEDRSGTDSKESQAKVQKATTISYAVYRIAQLAKRYPEYKIGVLVRSNAVLTKIIRGLKELKIEASEDAGAPIVDSPATLAVLSLFKLAAHPGDNVAAFHIANVAPLAKRFKLSVGSYQDAAARRASYYMRNRIETFGLGFFAEEARNLLFEIFDDQRNRDRLNKFVNFAYTYEANEPDLALDQFINAVSHAKVDSSIPAQVRVMTIHHSKGLEFDIVVLPELDGSSRRDLLYLDQAKIYAGRKLKRNPITDELENSSLTPVERVTSYVNKELMSAMPLEYRQIFAFEQQKQLEEGLALLYVAITRPRRMLLAIINPLGVNSDKKDSDEKKKKEAVETEVNPHAAGDSKILSSANILRRALDPGAQNEKIDPTSPYFRNAQVIYEHGVSDWAEQERAQKALEAPEQKPESTALADPSFTHSSVKRLLLKRETPTGGRETLRWKPEQFFTRGTALHACFELVEWLDRDGLPTDEQLDRTLMPILMDYSEVVKTREEFKRICASPYVATLLSRASYERPELELSGPRPAVQLDAPNPNATWRVYRERPFSMLQSRTLWRGTIDRLVLLCDGENVVAADVVDYKSDRLRDRDGKLFERPEQLPNETLEEYRRQLGYYGRVVQTQYNLPEERVSLRLAFIAHNFTIDARS